VLQIQKEIGAQGNRMGNIEKSTADLAKTIEKITPQLDHVYGFSQHTAPHLATKAELENLRSGVMVEIGSRPTTTTILAILGVVLAIIGLPFAPDWWDHVKVVFSQSPPKVEAPAVTTVPSKK
jgi:hypothetical protein